MRRAFLFGGPRVVCFFVHRPENWNLGHVLFVLVPPCRLGRRFSPADASPVVAEVGLGRGLCGVGGPEGGKFILLPSSYHRKRKAGYSVALGAACCYAGWDAAKRAPDRRAISEGVWRNAAG